MTGRVPDAPQPLFSRGQFPQKVLLLVVVGLLKNRDDDLRFSSVNRFKWTPTVLAERRTTQRKHLLG